MSSEFLKTIFQKVDKDANEYITVEELHQALSNGSWTPFNPETVRLMVGMFDTDRSGTIKFEEFSSLWKYITDWQTTFRTYDRDNSGSIDRHELKMALSSFGYRLTDQFYESLVKRFGRSEGDSVAFDDFIQCACTIQKMTNKFQAYDINRTGGIDIEYEPFLTLVFSFRNM